jgi:hypothetical protein
MGYNWGMDMKHFFRFGLFAAGLLAAALSLAAIDPDWDEKGDFPAFSLPSQPVFPTPARPANSRREPVRLSEFHTLTVTEALPSGDRKKNAAGGIDRAEYLLYSDGSRELKIFFKNAPRYVYYASRPRPPLQLAPNLFRAACDVIIQAGSEILGDSYSGEISCGKKDLSGPPSSFTVFGGGAALVVFNFTNRPGTAVPETARPGTSE